MSIGEQITSDVRDAMRAGDSERVSALRLVLSELQKAAKDGSDDELAVLRRERKRREEAARAFRDGGREELAAGEEREAALISGYLPPELSDAELRAIVDEVLTSVQERDMGRVMRPVMAAVDGRADGRRVSAVVREALGS